MADLNVQAPSLEELLNAARRAQFDPFTQALQIGQTLPVSLASVREEQARRPGYQALLAGDASQFQPKSLDEAMAAAKIKLEQAQAAKAANVAADILPDTALRAIESVHGLAPGTLPSGVTSKQLPFLVEKKRTIGQNELSDTEMQAIGKALSEGKLRPAQMTYRGPKLKALAQQFMANPEFNASESDIAFRGGTAGAAAKARVRQGTGQTLGALVGTTEDILNNIEPYIKQLSPTSIAALNDAYRRGLQQVADDPEASYVLTHINEATGLYSSVLRGGLAPTEESIKSARDSIGRGLGPGAFSGMKQAVLFAGKSRLQRLQGAGINEPVKLEQLRLPSQTEGPPPGYILQKNAKTGEIRYYNKITGQAIPVK